MVIELTHSCTSVLIMAATTDHPFWFETTGQHANCWNWYNWSFHKGKLCFRTLWESNILSLLLVSSWIPLFHQQFGYHDWQFLSGPISRNFDKMITWAHLNRKSSFSEFCRKSWMVLKTFAHCYFVIQQILGITGCIISKHPWDHRIDRMKMKNQVFFSCSTYHSKHNVHHP